MDVVFNSLFDSELTPEDSLYYPIDKYDTTLLLSNMVFQEDVGKRTGIEALEKRQFGTHANYILSGRPCSAGLCSSGKFCDSGGWPESPISKRDNPCELPFSPNSGRGDPTIWIDNIEIEAKLRNIDYINSKCQIKKLKEIPCANNPDRCALKCHTNTVNGDYVSPSSKLSDTYGGGSPSLLSDGTNRVKELKANYCKKLPARVNTASKMRTNITTKRRDTVKW